MKLRDYLQKNGIKVPQRLEIMELSQLKNDYRQGWNEVIDYFQEILDLDIGEPLDEEKLIKVMHECGHPDDLDEYAKVICREFRQPPLRLPSEEELKDFLNLKCNWNVYCIDPKTGEQQGRVPLLHVAKAIIAEIERRNK